MSLPFIPHEINDRQPEESPDATIIRSILIGAHNSMLENVEEFIRDDGFTDAAEAANADLITAHHIRHVLDHWADVYSYITDGDIADTFADLTR